MLHVEIPISSFLKKALNASLNSNYLALMLLVARSADANDLQDGFIRQWESLDDITHEQILFLVPRPSNAEEAKVTAGDGVERHAVVSSVMTFVGTPSGNWSDAFDKSSPETNLAFDLLCNQYGEYRQKQPDLDAQRAAITASATETASFFGLGESMIPCLLVIVPPEKQIFAIHLPNVFSIYSFTRSMLISCEEQVTAARSGSTRDQQLPSGLVAGIYKLMERDGLLKSLSQSQRSNNLTGWTLQVFT